MITSVRLVPQVQLNRPVDFNNKIMFVHSGPIDGQIIDQFYRDFGSKIRISGDPNKRHLVVEEFTYPFNHLHYFEFNNGFLNLMATDTHQCLPGGPTRFMHTQVPIVDPESDTPRIWSASNYIKQLFQDDGRPYDDAYLWALTELRKQHANCATQEVSGIIGLGSLTAEELQKLDRECREAEGICGRKAKFLDAMITDIILARFGHNVQSQVYSDVLKIVQDSHNRITFKELERLFDPKAEVDTLEKQSSMKIERDIEDSADTSKLFKQVYRGISEQLTGELVTAIVEYAGIQSNFLIEFRYDPDGDKLYITKEDIRQLYIAPPKTFDIGAKAFRKNNELLNEKIPAAFTAYAKAAWEPPLKDVSNITLEKYGPILVISLRQGSDKYKYAIPILEMAKALPLFHNPYLSD